MLCLNKELTLTPKEEKTNLSLFFTVPEGEEKMKLSFSYSPKVLEDEERSRELITACLIRDGEESKISEWRSYLPIVNLLTLSLDDPEDYRGCAHRHDREQAHYISADSASSGFISGKLQGGEWRLMLNIHALVTQECHCKITVETGGADLE